MSQSSTATIGAVLICYNEERIIRHALASVAGWAAEIVIVDSQSTDNTVSICREFTNKIHIQPWQGFSAQRNFALGQMTSDWIFILDADEVVTSALVNEMRAAVTGAANGAGEAAPVAFRMPRRSWFCGRFLQWGGNYPDHVLRLLRRGCGEYGERFVHEALQVEGPVGQLREPLLHYTYPTLDIYFGKFDHYSRLGALQMQREGKRWKASAVLLRPVTTFISRYFVKRGYRDGWQGLLYAMLAAHQVFAKHARLWELERLAEHEAQLQKSLADAAGDTK